jgi:DNA-binding XRE family transcriptional regulator
MLPTVAGCEEEGKRKAKAIDTPCPGRYGEGQEVTKMRKRKKGRPEIPASKRRAREAAGERFARGRVDLDLTQAQAGAILGVSRRTISSWEGGHGEIPEDALERLAESEGKEAHHA